MTDKLIHFAAKQKLAHYCKASVHQSKLIKRKCIFVYAAAAAKSLQSCLTLCDPIDGSPPGSTIPGILQQEHWSGLPFPSPTFVYNAC